MQEQILQNLALTQRIDKDGRIIVKGYARLVRYLFLSALVVYLIVGGYNSINLGDPFMIYSTIVPIYSIALLAVAWLIYSDPAKGGLSNELVSVIIPIYNQKSMIRLVIDSVFMS